MYETARAAIIFTDTSNLTTPWFNNGAGTDGPFSASNAFTVTAAPGTSVLVVPFDEYAQSNSGLDVSPTIQWITSGGTQTLHLGVSQVSANGSFVLSQVYYLFNPNVGTGTITLSGSGRAYAMNAYTLSLANTSVLPVPYVAASTTVNPATLSLASSTVANSFAATAEADRLSGNGVNITSWNFTSTTGTASLPWFRADPPDGQVGFGGGYVNGVAGVTTISSSPGSFNGNRNVMAAAVFTPLAAPVGAIAWGGTAGNGNWDIGATKNWQNASIFNYYLEPNNGVLFDDSAGTLGGTTNVVVAQVVSPQSVAFNNNAYPYIFTASGAGAISGPGALTLSGTGLVALNMANTYSGGTIVNAGTLQIGNASGSATGSGPVTIAAGATLSGSGFISTSGTNAVTVSGAITPDSSPGVYNTLTANTLNLNSGSTLNLNFNTPSPGQHDLISVTGGLTLASGTVNINAANLSGTWSPGAYPFVNYSTLTNGNPTFNLVNTSGTLGTSHMSIDESVPGVITIDVLSAAASKTLSWVGNVNSGGNFLWDIGNTLNWTSSGSSSVYNEGNRVVFSNTATNFVVTVNQQVNPSSVTFGNLSNSYTLTGSGGIASTTLGVAVNGGGTVTFQNTNAYSTATTVTNGSTLIVNGSLPNSNVIVTGAFIGGTGRLAATPASLTLNGATALTAGSNLTVNGPTNVASGTFTIPAGATLSGNGGINAGSGAQLIVNGIAGVGQSVTVNSATLSGSGAVNGPLNLTSATLASAGTLALGGAVTNSGTSAVSSGIISAGGPWTGSGAINIPGGSGLLLGGAASTGSSLTLYVSGTLTGGGAVNSPVNVSGSATVAINAGNVPTLNVVSSNLSNGVTVGAGATVGTSSLGVSGGLTTMNNTNTIPVAALSGGTINLAGPTVTVATVSGSNTVVNVTAGSVPTLNVTNGNLTGGVTVGAGASACTTSASVSGGLVTMNNTNTIPIAALSGGTTNMAGPNVTAATVSGGNTVVNVTAGSVPTLNVVNSNLIGGVTVSSGASAGSTSLSVSGGLVTLNNGGTIPSAALSGGTTNLSGPSVTAANISGGAVVSVSKGSVGALTASGSGLTTVSSSAAVSNLVVLGGRVNVSSTTALSVLAVSGGTVNLPVGTTSVGTANFGVAGAATQVTPNTLVVSNQLTFNGGAAATISNGNTFTYTTSGSNLANTSAANTLTISGGVLTVSPSLTAGPAINVFVAGAATGLNYTGTGPSSDAGTVWNRPGLNATTNSLVNSSGGTTTVSYTAALNNGTFNDGGASSTLLSAYSYGPTQTFTFGGLTPGVQYNLYAINNSNAPGRATTFTTGGSSQTVTTQANWATATFATSPALYCQFTGLLANASGEITVATSGPAEVDVNGFQLIPFNMPSGSVSLPNSSIVAAGASTLDFSGAGPANALGGLSLAGNETVQNVTSGGSVQFGGDVVASGNATVSLAAGTGSVPVLVLSGNTSGVQNVKAANGMILNLPSVAISAATVNIGNTSGYSGSVVLGGATAFTAGGATVTVNAGTLKVGGTIVAAAGANVQVNSGAALAGGPAGAIQLPVTLAAGSTLLPDSTAAFTALIGNSLTINGGGALQWVYSGSGAEGTLALGSGSLNLPGQLSGNPVFRPQFVIAPTLPVYVMTWNSLPANQPAWSFDGSLVTTGNLAVWNDANGPWDTGANWLYPSYTSATLSYQPGGLQLTGLGVTNVTGTAAPAAGANVLIAPPSTSSVAVTGPSAPVSLGALIIEGSGSATSSLTLQSGGPISATSVTVSVGGALAANSAALNMATGILSISGGSANLSNPSTLVGTATVGSGLLSVGGGSVGTAAVNDGVLSLGGGALGTLVAGGGVTSVSGGTVANAQISGTAAVNASAGALTILSASGGNTTVTAPARVETATVSGGVASLNNTNAMTGLTVSGGSVAINNSATVATAALSGGTTAVAGATLTAATISGGAIVNVTAGSVPTLNVLASDLTHGVTVGGGASAGSTALSVSGGLVTLNNTNTIPTATFSGGTTTLAGPTVVAANLSGSARVNVGAADTVIGTTTIGGGTLNVADSSGLGLERSTVMVNTNNGLAFGVPTARLGSLSGAGGFALPATMLTVGANNADTIYGGTLRGGGGLTKTGSGTLLLTSSSTYTGPTLIDAGTLKLTSGVSGFGGNGSGWTVTDGANAPTATAIAANVLTLTDNGPPIFETRSAFYNNKVPTGAFTASFVYQAAGFMQADGVTFTLQNSPAGPAALGPNAAGSNLGYFGITPSAAIQLNIYPGDPGGIGSAFTTGGTLSAYTSTSPVNLASGDPIQVMLSYDGSNLVENLTDQTNGQKYSKTYTGVNLTAATGGTSAYVGFTGATGGEFAIQTISNFTFIAGVGNGNLSGLPAATAVNISANAVFDLGGANQTIASLSDGGAPPGSGGGSVVNSAPTLLSILTVSPTGSSTTFSGSIASGGTLGSIELVLNGTGTQVLSGTNTYTGGTFVDNGTLIATNPQAIADGSSLTVGNAAEFAPTPPVPAAAVAPVPEPDTIGVLATAGAVLLFLHSRQRCTAVPDRP
jgi:autotransporter-associated beta strand protein